MEGKPEFPVTYNLTVSPQAVVTSSLNVMLTEASVQVVEVPGPMRRPL
jgi:hypothetical protein